MRNQIRKIARQIFPDAIRKPLGSLAGKIDAAIFQPVQGLIFDLSGGKFKTGGCAFIIPKDQTSLVYRSSFLTGQYETEDLQVVQQFIRAEDKVLELGACMGIVSCITNKLLANKTLHVVVEANPFCIPILHKNRDLNGCKFLIEHCAVSPQPEVTFNINPNVIVGSSLHVKSDLTVRVPAKTLNELEHRYGPFTALIVDIEGAELETFENSADVLRRMRIVIVELHDWALGEAGLDRCRKILSDAGLKFEHRVQSVEAWRRP